MIRVVVSCLLLVVVLLIFSSCSTFKSEKQVEVITQEIEKPKLNLDVVVQYF